MHGTRRRLEALAGVLGCDTASGTVALRLWSALLKSRALLLEAEVDLGGSVRVGTVEQANVTDAVEGNTHGNLELGGRNVNACHHLGGRVLDLQTRVELQEVELVVGVRVEVLDGTGRDVTNELTERDSCLLHLGESRLSCNGDGSLFDNLLMSALDGAVTTEERDVVAVLIGKKLDFQVASIACKLHDEDGRSRNFAGSSVVQLLEVLLILNHADTLSTAALGGLDHDGETNLPRRRETLCGRLDATLLVYLILDCDNVVVVYHDLVNAGTRPGNARNAGVLCNDCGRNLVTQ